MSKCPNCKNDSLSFETEDNLPLENPYCFECSNFMMRNLIDDKDNINPDHYKNGEIECIDAIQSSMTNEAFKGYLKGNIIKYVWRFENKNRQECLKKAIWYTDRLIKETSNG